MKLKTKLFVWPANIISVMILLTVALVFLFAYQGIREGVHRRLGILADSTLHQINTSLSNVSQQMRLIASSPLVASSQYSRRGSGEALWQDD